MGSCLNLKLLHGVKRFCIIDDFVYKSPVKWSAGQQKLHNNENYLCLYMGYGNLEPYVGMEYYTWNRIH